MACGCTRGGGKRGRGFSKLTLTRRFQQEAWKRTGKLPGKPSVYVGDTDWCDSKRTTAEGLRNSLVGYLDDLVRETGAKQGPRCKHLHSGVKYFLREGDERLSKGQTCMAVADYINGIRWAGAAAACVRTDPSCPAPGAINVVKYRKE